eukprot:CAMPEP_0113942470 /NCGR_PEP_ID=MMETSP1339-20121228/8183_1 /TAXON_ID=94617 /ORGANISM="Fibrocapsa japonica" /LENGTH=135 /DNA_ID=CAMNT_0000946963 /DNA_START=18 /DNA_END=422 /DNA_ORIENTATION=+ /assembly_acc=CAM_ASM_000762
MAARAVSLVAVEGTSISLTQEALEIIEGVDGPLALVCCFGNHPSEGISTLLGIPDMPDAVCSGAEGGIKLIQPALVERSSGTGSVLLLLGPDLPQGGSSPEGSALARVLAACLLMSSALVYFGGDSSDLQPLACI